MNLRTNKKYNLDILSSVGFGTFEMPELIQETIVPTQIIGFNYALTRNSEKSFIHFYLDDYQFERVWNNPSRYIELFKRFDGIFSPDFSLYKNMPLPIQIYNTYRSRFLGKYYQEHGIKVITTVSWSDDKSFDFCFEGVPKNSVISVSNVGVLNNKSSKKMFMCGFEEMIKRICPSQILIYGKKMDLNYDNIIYFRNETIERLDKINGR